MHIYLWQIDPPIEHRSSIDLCKTITPQKFDT